MAETRLPEAGPGISVHVRARLGPKPSVRYGICFYEHWIRRGVIGWVGLGGSAGRDQRVRLVWQGAWVR